MDIFKQVTYLHGVFIKNNGFKFEPCLSTIEQGLRNAVSNGSLSITDIHELRTEYLDLRKKNA